MTSLKTAPDFLAAELAHITEEIPNWFRESLSFPRDEGVLEVENCPIHYFRWGDPKKRGVMMTHGFLAHARCFAFIAPFLARDFHVAAFDLSGMGDSGTRPSYDSPTRARELFAIADHLGMIGGEPFIVAHSYGGAIGLEAMELFGDSFGGLVVCDMMVMRPEKLALFHKDRVKAMRGRKRPNWLYPDLPTAMARYRLAPPQSCDNRYLMDYMAHHSLKKAEGGWTWKFDPGIFRSDDRGESWWGDQARRLARLASRRAILYGERSMMFTKDSADYLREEGAPPFPILAVPHANHHLMLDQPLAFATALRAILTVWAAALEG